MDLRVCGVKVAGFGVVEGLRARVRVWDPRTQAWSSGLVRLQSVGFRAWAFKIFVLHVLKVCAEGP